MKITREMLNTVLICLAVALGLGWYLGNYLIWLVLAFGIGIFLSLRERKP